MAEEGAAAGVSVEAVRANSEQLAAACAELKAQRKAREANLRPHRPAEDELGRLDSSIKKNGAFIKKLRQLSADNRAQLLAEATRLNLSKYVSEAVAALAEVPLKAADVPAAVEMATALHARYPDFAASLGPALAKAAAGSKGAAEDERVAARRQRGALRLLSDLIVAGIIPDASGLLDTLKAMVVGMDFSKARESSLHSATLLGSLAKPATLLLLGAPPEGADAPPLPPELLHAEDLSALPAELAEAVADLQAQQKSLEQELKLRYQLPPEQRQLMVKVFDRTFDFCSAALVEWHKALLAQDKENARAFASKGELPEGAAAEYEAARKAYEALHRTTSAMAEALRKPLPELREDAFTRIGAEEADSGGGASAGGAVAGAEAAPEHVFEDPEVRAFYEQLPDLWSLVPTVLLKDATAPRRSSESGGAVAAAAAAAAAEPPPPAAEPDPVAAAADAAAAAGAEPPGAVDDVLSRLASCVSRDLCDELSVNFCFANSKAARKKLARALADVPRGNLQLLPYYARVAATVSQAYPEVGAGVVSAVEAEFDALAAKKDLTRAGEEPRLRVARYLAELAKFRLAPPSSVLLRLKALLDDFSGPSVDAAAALVESAGRFLLRLPESHVRMENLLAVMMRLRNARNLDSRQANAVDSAYFACRPPDRASQRRRRPPLQEYIRHLVFEVLGDGSIVDVLKKLMKLPWAEAEPYLLKCLLKVSRVRFSHIALIASLAGGLAQYHDSLGVGLVDLVLEDVRWGLDHPGAGNYQQRMAQVRLLGEAYNYMLLDSRAVFDVLYTLIGHGHESEEAAMRLDPPDDFFRVRLVIALLSTCGSYFSKGAARRRLDRFLTFLQAYVAAKQPLPLDVDADLQDLYDLLRPGLERFKSYDEAAAAVGGILSKEAAASASGLEPIDEEDDDDEEGDDGEEGGGQRGRRGGGRASGSGGEDSGGEGGGEDDEEDEHVYDRGGGRGGGGALEQQPDEDFEREYAALMQECQGRPVAAPSAAAAAGAAPSGGSGGGGHERRRDGRWYRAGADEDEGEGEEDEDGELEGDGAPTVAFRLLMKRGGKDDRSREIHIPADAAIAVRVMAQQESEAAERSQIKALVLEANLRDEAAQRAADAAAVQRGAAAGGARRGGRSGGRGGGMFRLPDPPGAARQGSGGWQQQQQQQGQGPQLTLRQHVRQLTGEKE